MANPKTYATRKVRALQPCFIDLVLRQPGEKFLYSGPPAPGVMAEPGDNSPTLVERMDTQAMPNRGRQGAPEPEPDDSEAEVAPTPAKPPRAKPGRKPGRRATSLLD